MLIIPAIDIQDGRCVRLYQGDFGNSTVYANDPATVAREWQAQGAEFLHIVDLDGAKGGRAVNTAAIKAIAATVTIPFELGGGIRTTADIDAGFALGASCIVLGTIAITDRELLNAACQRYPQRLVVALDARDDQVVLRGWQESSTLELLPLARELVASGVMCLMYTDIARDGALTGPNLTTTRALVNAVNVPVIASGGVASLADLAALRDIGVEGAIVGKALYERRFTLEEAIAHVA